MALAVTAPAGAALAAPGDPGFLGDAATFSVLAHTDVTNSGAATLLNRDLGVEIGAVTGLTPLQVQGASYINDPFATSAQTDVTTAVNDLMAVPSYVYGATDLAGHTFVAGHYSSATGLNNTGTITLQGDADDVFIFTAVSDITLGSLNVVNFIGGAQPCNLFWRAGSSASIGTNDPFVGTMIAGASITVNTDATINGALLAQTGLVSLLNNPFTNTPCVAGGDGLRGLALAPPAPTVTVVVPPVVVPPVVVPPVVTAPAAVAPAAVLAETAVDNRRPMAVAFFVVLLGAAMLTASTLARRRIRH